MPSSRVILRAIKAPSLSVTFSGTVTLRSSPMTSTISSVTQAGTWAVGSNSATGSAVPANAFMSGMTDGTSLRALGNAPTNSNTTGVNLLGVGNLGYDGTNYQLIGAPLQTATSSNTAQAMMLVGSGVQSDTFSVQAVQAGTTYDVGNFASVMVQVTSQYVGTTPTITFQTSNDGTNWYSQTLKASTSTSGGGVATTTTTTGLWFGDLTGRYFRLNFTGTYSSGTAAGVIVFSTRPHTIQALQANVTSQSTTGSAVPTTAYYHGINARTSSPTAVTNGQLVGLTGDVMGEALVATGGGYGCSSGKRKKKTQSNTIWVIVAVVVVVGILLYFVFKKSK